MIWAITLLAVVALAAAAPLAERLRPAIRRATRNPDGWRLIRLSQGMTAYRWDGPVTGPVVVCVHGLTTPALVWDAVVRGLVLMGFRVLRYDLYGRGLSDRPGGAQDRAFFLTQLRDLLHAQAVAGRFMLIGYSMGGAIATAFAAAWPARVERLVLLAPSGLGHQASRAERFITRVPGLGDWLMLLLGGVLLRRAIGRAALAPSAVEGLYAAQMHETRMRGFLPAVLSSRRHMLSEDMEPCHRAIAAQKIPVLAIWGKADPVIPLSALGRLAQINPAARQEMVEEAGHGLPYTHPGQVHAALQSFLRDA